MSKEVIDNKLTSPPNLAEYEARHGVTHTDFEIYSNRGLWGVKARLREDWYQRLKAAQRPIIR